MITTQDFKDSLNPFHPAKYIRARIKGLPYVLVVCTILGLILAILSFLFK